MPEYKAVIDTNVLVSSLIAKRSDSPTVILVEKIFDSEIIPLFNDEILDEYHEVLRREKFNFSERLVDTFLDTIQSLGTKIQASPCKETLPDMNDLPFYEVFLEARNENAYLITGNLKHFPQSPFILNPSEFLKTIKK